jgi:LacI family transcriptional regulator
MRNRNETGIRSGHVTLQDVADTAGVSVSTASRALASVRARGKNDERVRKVAAKLGYVPNEAARSLRSERTMTIGVVFAQLNSPLATELLDALSAGLDEHGYSLFVATARGVEGRFDQLVQRFLERRVDALFCVNPAGKGAALRKYAKAKIPVIALFSKADGYERLPLIGPTIAHAANEAMAHLRSRGHVAVGVLRPAGMSRPIEGIRDFARAAGMKVRVYDVADGLLDPAGFLRSYRADAARPTVLIARQNDAVRLLEAADQLSIKAPRDLSIIAIRDRTQQMPSTRLPLSMIHLNPANVGVEAARTLVHHLIGGSALPSGDRLVDAGSWVEGGTIGSGDSAAPQPTLKVARRRG